MFTIKTPIFVLSLTRDEYNGLVSNINEIVEVHQSLLKSLADCSATPPEQQRIGRVFLTSAPKVKQAHQKYCSTHPRAIVILEKYRYVFVSLFLSSWEGLLDHDSSNVERS